MNCVCMVPMAYLYIRTIFVYIYEYIAVVSYGKLKLPTVYVSTTTVNEKNIYINKRGTKQNENLTEAK